jgi:glucan phosphorylase
MVFCFVQKKFSNNTRVRIFIFFVAQNLTLDYMTKTLNQIFFYSSTKIRIFFSATLGIRIFFLENYSVNKLVGYSFPRTLSIQIVYIRNN